MQKSIPRTVVFYRNDTTPLPRSPLSSSPTPTGSEGAQGSQAGPAMGMGETVVRQRWSGKVRVGATVAIVAAGEEGRRRAASAIRSHWSSTDAAAAVELQRDSTVLRRGSGQRRRRGGASHFARPVVP
jgi:hypothetical protein